VRVRRLESYTERCSNSKMRMLKQRDMDQLRNTTPQTLLRSYYLSTGTQLKAGIDVHPVKLVCLIHEWLHKGEAINVIPQSQMTAINTSDWYFVSMDISNTFGSSISCRDSIGNSTVLVKGYVIRRCLSRDGV
jgi:hypothetical protein